jgi:hypothetical protein|tara:strand:+ start:633 stop:1265 length:633 start_codon:yes stop_codon:yes gene_type:complete
MLGFAPIAKTALGSPTPTVDSALEAASGTFTLSMQGAAKLITDVYPSGTFVTNGRAVTFRANRPADFDTGVFTLTGQNITFDQNFGLIVDSVYNSATFTYTGQSVVLDTGFGIAADNGSFTLTGRDIDFTKAMNVSADAGTFAYTGQDALKGVGEAFAVGSFTYTGQDVTLFAGRFINAENGSYTTTMQEFKIKGWLSPQIPDAIWTDAP